jgi:hypothetical protein
MSAAGSRQPGEARKRARARARSREDSRGGAKRLILSPIGEHSRDNAARATILSPSTPASLSRERSDRSSIGGPLKFPINFIDRAIDMKRSEFNENFGDAERCRVQPRQVRTWARKGKITAYRKLGDHAARILPPVGKPARVRSEARIDAERARTCVENM